MKTITKSTLIILLSVTFMKAQITQKWLQIGSGTSKNQTNQPSMAFDRAGNLFLAYTDLSSPQNKATLKKFDGQSWTTLSSQFTPGQAQFIKLDLDTAGVPYVAFQEPYPITKKITVMKFNGIGWDTIGARGFATADFGSPELDFNINLINNIPCVAFRENSSGKASVMMKIGSNWSYNGGAGLTQGNATKLSLSCQGSACYLAFRNGVKGNKLSVITDNGGGGWTYSGDTVLSTGIPDYINCKRYLGYSPNFVAVAFKDADDNKAYLKASYNSNPWQTIGGSALSDGTANYITLLQKRGVGINSSFYCGYSDVSSGGNATVKKGSISAPTSSCTLVGKKGFTDTLGIFASSYFATIGIDQQDSLYMAVQSFNEYVVFKYRNMDMNLVSLSENSLNDGILIYPNPTEDKLTIKVASSSSYSLKLLTIDGKVLSEKNPVTTETITLNLSEYPRGIYFIEIVDGETIKREKIIKY